MIQMHTRCVALFQVISARCRGSDFPGDLVRQYRRNINMFSLFSVSAFWASKETFSFQTLFLICTCKHTPTPIQLSLTSFERIHVDSLRWCTCPWYIHQLALESTSSTSLPFFIVHSGRVVPQSLWWRAEGAAYVKGGEKIDLVLREIDRCQMLGCLSLFPFHWKTSPRKFAAILSVNGGGTGFIMTSSRWGFHAICTVHDFHLLQSFAFIHLDPYG